MLADNSRRLTFKSRNDEVSEKECFLSVWRIPNLIYMKKIFLNDAFKVFSLKAKYQQILSWGSRELELYIIYLPIFMTERVLGAGRDRVKEFPGPSPLFSWAHSCISILLPNLQHTSAFPEFQTKNKKYLQGAHLCVLSSPVFPLETWSFPSAMVSLILCRWKTDTY